MNKLELRMYGLVPYNLSPIQQGIQFGHAVVRYGQMIKRLPDKLKHIEDRYNDWADNYETFIILNGGTTNNNTERLGTLNKHLLDLKDIGVPLHDFYEPDLGDQLTGFVFIVDERIFDKEKYPDFPFKEKNQLDIIHPIFSDDEEKESWANWVVSIGGIQNLRLRHFLKQFKLA